MGIHYEIQHRREPEVKGKYEGWYQIAVYMAFFRRVLHQRPDLGHATSQSRGPVGFDSLVDRLIRRCVVLGVAPHQCGFCSCIYLLSFLGIQPIFALLFISTRWHWQSSIICAHLSANKFHDGFYLVQCLVPALCCLKRWYTYNLHDCHLMLGVRPRVIGSKLNESKFTLKCMLPRSKVHCKILRHRVYVFVLNEFSHYLK